MRLTLPPPLPRISLAQQIASATALMSHPTRRSPARSRLSNLTSAMQTSSTCTPSASSPAGGVEVRLDCLWVLMCLMGHGLRSSATPHAYVPSWCRGYLRHDTQFARQQRLAIEGSESEPCSRTSEIPSLYPSTSWLPPDGCSDTPPAGGSCSADACDSDAMKAGPYCLKTCNRCSSVAAS